MDPVSQGAFGALAAQSIAKHQQLGRALLIGLLAGMSPDLDVLIRSGSDPLLFFEYHRQFTHSLTFIPIGGLLCSIALYFVFSRRWGFTFFHTYILATAAYATHGLLDCFTSYGTVYFWPMSQFRVSWDWISIIDPFITLPLLGALLLAAFWRNKSPILMVAIYLSVYFSIAGWQHQRAIALGKQVAHSRGHNPVRLDAKPSFGNIIVWKILYESGGNLYVDAIRPSLGNGHLHWLGESREKLTEADAKALQLAPDSQQLKDIERFRWFSQDWLALSPSKENSVVDMRYSLLPNNAKALWGVEFNPEAVVDAHVNHYAQRREPEAAFNILWQMIRGNYPDANILPGT